MSVKLVLKEDDSGCDYLFAIDVTSGRILVDSYDYIIDEAGQVNNTALEEFIEELNNYLAHSV